MSEGPENGMVSIDPSVPTPLSFLTSLAAEISEIEELQIMLAVVRLAHDLGGFDHAIAQSAFERDRWLRKALRLEGSPKAPSERIAKGLELATSRGSLLRFATCAHAETNVWYYVNTPDNHARLARMATGALAPPDELLVDGAAPTIEPERPNVFRLYEQNIGLLTPLIADRIVAAIERYPAQWIEDAITEAVAYNRRNWRYVARVLENWAVAGRGEGVHGESSNAENRRRHAHPLDPDQYRNGRHLDRTGGR
jgi:DnaD/phage-associated family protein